MLSRDGWSRDEAVALCRMIEQIAPKFGAHVALTGGCLYKDGVRKDCDVVLYRIRQRDEIEMEKLFAALRAALGIEIVKECGFVIKARQGTNPVDFLVPEEGGEYPIK